MDNIQSNLRIPYLDIDTKKTVLLPSIPFPRSRSHVDHGIVQESSRGRKPSTCSLNLSIHVEEVWFCLYSIFGYTENALSLQVSIIDHLRRSQHL